MPNQPSTCLSSKDEPIPRLIYHTAQDMKNLAEKILAPYDLTVEQLFPLKILFLNPGLTQRQIGDECNKTPANLTRILDRLQKKSLIERCNNPNDRRASLVYLTKQGENLVKEVSGIFDSLTEHLLAGISEQEQLNLRKSLQMIAKNQDTLNETYKLRLPKD